MALTNDEQRVLDAVESRFRADDPLFVARFERPSRISSRRRRLVARMSVLALGTGTFALGLAMHNGVGTALATVGYLLTAVVIAGSLPRV